MYSLVMQQNKFKTMDAKTTAAHLILDYLTLLGNLDDAKACALIAAKLVAEEYDIDLDPQKRVLWDNIIYETKNFNFDAKK